MNSFELAIGAEVVEWQHVKSRGFGNGEIFISADAGSYLRVGDKDRIRQEARLSRRFYELGFPIAEVLAEGEIAGQGYFIEASLGKTSLADTFAEEYAEDHAISDQHFDSYTAVASRLLGAQLRTGPQPADQAAQRAYLMLDEVVAGITENADVVTESYQLAQRALSELPPVYSHGDFGPMNIFPNGVIDWEDTAILPVGFDVLTSPYLSRFWQPPTGPWAGLLYDFQPNQIERYRQTMDDCAAAHGLEALSSHRDDVLILKAISLAGYGRRHQQASGDARKWQHRKAIVEYCAGQYLNGRPIHTATFENLTPDTMDYITNK